MVRHLKRSNFFVIFLAMLALVPCVHANEQPVPVETIEIVGTVETTPEIIAEVKTGDNVAETVEIPEINLETQPETKSEIQQETKTDPTIETKIETKTIEQPVNLLETKSGTFYDAYLSKYFPKAMVIREKFIDGMSYDAVVIGLYDSVKLLSDDPRFYVANKEEIVRFTHYWEFVLDQLVLIHGFLKKAYVNLQNHNILIIENKYSYLDGFALDERKKWLKGNLPFVDYIVRQHPDVIYSFYALMCDYIIKLFNEGILLQDHALANKYYRELEYVVEKLGGSSYEVDYQEATKTGKDLLALLKHKDTIKDVEKFDEKHGHRS